MTDPITRLAADSPTTGRGKTAIVLFTLTPETEGRRKRIAGRESGAAIFHDLIRRIERTCRELPVDLLIASPRPIVVERAAWLPQRGGGFADSLCLAVNDAFALGYERVVAIGNDSPEICTGYLRQAIRLLAADTRSTVLGPSRDGGFVLLGLPRPVSRLFDGMNWGGSDVAARIGRRLRDEGLDLRTLRTLDEIDDSRGLQRYLVRAGSLSTRRLRRQLAPPRPPRDAAIPVLYVREPTVFQADRAPPTA